MGPAAQSHLISGCLSDEFQLPTPAADVHQDEDVDEPENFSEFGHGDALYVERDDKDVGLLWCGRPLKGEYVGPPFPDYSGVECAGAPVGREPRTTLREAAIGC